MERERFFGKCFCMSYMIVIDLHGLPIKLTIPGVIYIYIYNHNSVFVQLLLFLQIKFNYVCSMNSFRNAFRYFSEQLSVSYSTGPSLNRKGCLVKDQQRNLSQANPMISRTESVIMVRDIILLHLMLSLRN